MSELILHVQDLQVKLTGHTGLVSAVKKADFQIHRGEMFCLVGESGSGKTVTAHSIMRLIEEAEYADSSQIFLRDEALLSLPEIILRQIRGRKIAVIFQEPMTSLNPIQSIEYQITEVLTLHTDCQDRHQRCHELLSDVGIGDPEHVLQAYPHQLSGGMRQRIMIAIALAGEPDLLIADEPTTALDVTTQAQVLSLIQKISQKRNMSVLLITHDMAIVSNFADTVAVMHQGKILEMASRDDFFARPADPYSQHLLDCTMTLDRQELQGHFDFKHLDSILPILSVKELKVHYPIKKGLFKKTVGYIKAVDEVSFTVYQGQTLAIVGESGCGKSSTAFAFMRLLDCVQGQVIFQGQDLLKLSGEALRRSRRYIQMIFQDPLGSLNPRMTIRDILSEGWDALGLFKQSQVRELKLIELMISVGLDEAGLSKYPHEFSGGQHQRIAIARALGMQPSLIVCDEPTSALDVSVQSQIIRLLKALQENQQVSYVFISHNIPVVSYLAHQIAVMYLGKIVEMGSVRDILDKPKHPYTQALLAAVPRIHDQKQPFDSPKGEIPSPAHPPSGCHFHPRCPYAMPQCRLDYPPVTQVDEGHQVRCYLY